MFLRDKLRQSKASNSKYSTHNNSDVWPYSTHNNSDARAEWLESVSIRIGVEMNGKYKEF